MKKGIALGLLLTLLLSLCLPACAEEDTLTRYTRLLTDYDWRLERASATGFVGNLKLLNLSNPDLLLTGDGSGQVYLVYFMQGRNTPVTHIYHVTFSADEQTLFLFYEAGPNTIGFEYVRQ